MKADFTYDVGRDVYVCPAGEELIYRYTTEERGIQLLRYWVNACQTCPSRANAPPARNGGLGLHCCRATQLGCLGSQSYALC